MHWIVGIEIRNRSHGDNFAGLHIQHHSTRGNCAIAVDGLDQHVTHNVLNTNINRKPNWLKRLAGCHSDRTQIT